MTSWLAFVGQVFCLSFVGTDSLFFEHSLSLFDKRKKSEKKKSEKRTSGRKRGTGARTDPETGPEAGPRDLVSLGPLYPAKYGVPGPVFGSHLGPPKGGPIWVPGSMSWGSDFGHFDDFGVDRFLMIFGVIDFWVLTIRRCVISTWASFYSIDAHILIRITYNYTIVLLLHCTTVLCPCGREL